VRAATVAATALMKWAKRAKMTPPEHLLPRYLLEFQGTPLCSGNACSYAAHGGDREALEWPHDNGCPWECWDDVCGRWWRAPGHVVAQPWLPVERLDV
jgi:hypothetical protein